MARVDGADREKTSSTGMAGFTVVWVGQIISMLGTAMSNFGFTLWAYEETGRATPLALVAFFYVTPMVLLGPVVGVLVDRGNRKLMMAVSDLSAAGVALLALALYQTGGLQVWHLYVIATILGIFQGFQWPAYSSAIALMLPKEQYGRANGMMSLAENGSGVFAPLLAGALIGPFGLGGILAIDLLTAAFAVSTLFFVHIPQPEQSASGREGSGGFLKETIFGFRYILARPSLLGLQSVFLVANFFSTLGYVVLAPMVLARSGNSEWVLGSVQSAAAVGGVAGGVAMSVWGGPKRRVHGVLLGWFSVGALGMTLFGLGRGLVVWAVFNSAAMFFSPILNGSNQALWQAKVPPDVQGRVFTARMFIAWMVMPISNLVAGPLVDQVLEPAMAVGGNLTPLFGGLVGSGPGSGMAVLFVCTGLLTAMVGLGGYMFPAIRYAEDILPDHDAVAATERPEEPEAPPAGALYDLAEGLVLKESGSN